MWLQFNKIERIYAEQKCSFAFSGTKWEKTNLTKKKKLYTISVFIF